MLILKTVVDFFRGLLETEGGYIPVPLFHASCARDTGHEAS